MKRILLTAIVGAMTLSAVPSYANHTNSGDEMFKEADENNDGMISESEHEKCAEKKFKAADKNSDDKLSKDEFTAFHEAKKERMKKLDGEAH